MTEYADYALNHVVLTKDEYYGLLSDAITVDVMLASVSLETGWKSLYSVPENELSAVKNLLLAAQRRREGSVDTEV